MNDVIVEPIRRVREELINRYGGIDGYFKHCQAQEPHHRNHKPQSSRDPWLQNQ